VGIPVGCPFLLSVEPSSAFINQAVRTPMRILKVFWVFVLVFSVGLGSLYVYTVYRRLSICSYLAEINFRIPPTDAQSWATRMLSYEKACGESPSVFTAFIIGGFAGLAIHNLRKRTESSN